jgi:hypothetical protein
MRIVEWIEPYHSCPDGSYLGTLTCRLPVEVAIASRKEMVKGTDFTYESDEQALDDFIVVHWAKVIDID